MWILSLLKPDRAPQPAPTQARSSQPPEAPSAMLFFELFSHAPDVLRVPAGQPLFAEGDNGREMYVLILGRADVTVGQRLVEVLLPGNVVGEMSLVAPGPRATTVTASVDCEFIAVDARRFSALVRQAPDFALLVMRSLADRLRRADGGM